MHFLVLSSVGPDFGHFRAAQTVLAALLEEIAALAHLTTIATVSAGPVADPTRQRLEEHGVRFMGDYSAQTSGVSDSTTVVSKAVQWTRELLISDNLADMPRFTSPLDTVRELEASGADAAILFWDTFFENLAPYFNIPVIGYLARPRFAAPSYRLGQINPLLKRVLVQLRLARQKQRHMRRVRQFAATANICALDAAWYRNNGIACDYISNTWPDTFAANWRQARTQAEARRSGIHILGNLGGLDATGNRFGLFYLAEEILPLLDEALRECDWRINICGRFTLPPEIAAKLVHPRVAIRGFVEDIDDEMAGNAIFLLLNNAGPYTGGYTRIIYAMASGNCIVAHRRLALSMPEIVHNENCLLGETPAEIANLLSDACRNHERRRRLGAAARRTYETRYAPRLVAERLVQIGSKVLA